MKNLFVIISMCCLFACDSNTNSSTQAPTKENTKQEIESKDEKMSAEEIKKRMNPEPESIDPKDYIGYYVGSFKAVNVKSGGTYKNKINISIDEIVDDKIKGHSIVAGNNRPFEGTFNPTKLEASVKEPGDDKYDGAFNFKFEFGSGGRFLVGTWESNDKKLKVTNREYKLDRRTFEYDKNVNLPERVGWKDLFDNYDRRGEDNEGEFLTEDVIKHNASSTELKAKDVENMYKGDLEVLRNSIYARHGYSFKNRKMRYVFDFIDWYIPVSTDIRSKLTALEKKNIDLLKRYEGHADRYYDVFGR